MTAALLIALVVLGLSGAFAWLLSRGAGATGAGPSPSGDFGLALRGYRMDQVDDVLDTLEAQVEANEAELAFRRGESPPPALVRSVHRPATGDLIEVAPAPAEDTPTTRRPPTPLPPEESESVGPRRGGWGWAAPAGILGALGLAVTLLARLVAGPGSGHLSQGVQDQQAFEWYFAATAHNVVTLSNPLFSDLQNYPAGVNLMANAATIGLGIPLTPLTVLASAHVTFLVVEILGLALTAVGWAWLLRRWLVPSRLAAALGGALCGFGPAMVSHANGHPNFVAAFLIPVIVDRVLLIHAEPQRWVRHGVVLGLLVAWQVFIGEEVLLLAVIGLALALVIPLIRRRVRVASLARGIALGAAVTLPIIAYPLWWQFAGPQSYTSLWHPPQNSDLVALWSRATRSIFADPWASAAVSMNRTEENAFFGPALWILAVAVVILGRRRLVVWALAFVIAMSCWFSLGADVVVRGVASGVPGPGVVLDHLPVLENVLATRYAMIALPAFAALLALAVDHLVHRWRPPIGYAVGLAVATVALVPVLPTPLTVDPRPVVPAFFTGDAWRGYVHGGSVLAAPPPDIVDARALDWQQAADMGFPLVEGYFVGPSGSEDGSGQYGARRTALSLWLYDVNAANVEQVPTPEQRQQFRLDLRAGQVDAVVVPVDRPEAGALRDSLVPLLGPATEVDGVFVWDARGFRDADD